MLAAVFVLTLLNGRVAALSSDVLIVEVQPESLTSASEEYVKIVNNTDAAIDVSNWYVQYFSVTATNFNTPTRNIKLSGSLAAHSMLVAASTGYMVGEATVFFAPTLASTGGYIRLVSVLGNAETQHDLLGWGTAPHPEGNAAKLIQKGQAYTRLKATNGLYIDTDNNLLDFAQWSTSLPLAIVPSSSAAKEAYPEIVITELLPDPASPKTDANDEFVEVFNPNKFTVNLKGYVIQTGTTYSYKYTIGDISLAAGSYAALMSSQTNLTLSNTSGRARLLDPVGGTVSESVAYGKAVTGSSWALFDNVWEWTSAVTPNAQNQLQASGAEQGIASVATLGKSKTTKQSGATTTKVSKTKTAKTTTPTAAKTAYKSPASDNKSLPISPLVLAGVGVPLLGYMLYEYRNDISNKIAQYKRNRSARRQARV